MNEFVSWFRSVFKYWKVNITGGVLIALLFLWQITGKRIPPSVYLLVFALTLFISTFLSWRDERRKTCELERELSEIYADVILCWLKDHCNTQCSFTAVSMEKALDLSSEKIGKGLSRLQEYKLIQQTPLDWQYYAVDAIRVRAGFKRIGQEGNEGRR